MPTLIRKLLKFALICVAFVLLLVLGIWVYLANGPYDNKAQQAVANPTKLPQSSIDFSSYSDSIAPEYFFAVKEYLDYMIMYGRDRYGEVHSPLFATTLDRKTGNVFRKNPPKAPKGIRDWDRTWRGANPSNHGSLYSLLYQMTEITGDPLYAEEANKAIDWFFENCQSETTGLMAWGEHMGWDFFKEEPIKWNALYFFHEFKGFGFWDRVWEVNPKAAERFARGLWDHQIYAKTGPDAGDFSRHANFFYHWPNKGRAFPSHGGKYMQIWARAYHETNDEEFLTAIKTLLDYYESQISPISGAIGYATDYPEQYSLMHNMGLAIRIYDCMHLVPEELGERMKAMADSTDPIFLSFYHDPSLEGHGFIKYAHVDTLKPGDFRQNGHHEDPGEASTKMWSSGYSASNSVGPANSCYERYKQTGIAAYRELFLKAVDAYYYSDPPQSKKMYPRNFSGPISMLTKAYLETGDTKYMEKAKQLLERSLEAVMDSTSPLPKASTQSEHYEAITGANGLMKDTLEIWEYLNESREAQPSKDSFTLRKEQITHGNHHHLFGYIGQSLTIPWNESGSHIVALRVPFHDRLPETGDAAEVILIDRTQNNTVKVLDETQGWNLQQGTMLYWNPEAPDSQFFFNDRDPSDGRVFTVLYDIEQQKRIMEYRYEDKSIGNSGVAPQGSFFAAINYGRLARLRPVTGYAGALDPTIDEPIPSDDGIFLVDIKTGAANLLVSFEQLAQLLESAPGWVMRGKRWSPTSIQKEGAETPNVREASLYINHTLMSRENGRVYFFVRGRKDRSSIWIDAPCSIKTDGTELKLHTTPIGGHPEWVSDSVLVGANNGHQVYYDVINEELLNETIGTPEIIPNPEGDVALSPNSQWLVNGYPTSDRQSIKYVLMRLEDGVWSESEAFDRGPYTRGNLRTDPAPRWNRKNDQLLVPGWSESGMRQLFILHIEPK